MEDTKWRSHVIDLGFQRVTLVAPWITGRSWDSRYAAVVTSRREGMIA